MGSKLWLLCLQGSEEACMAGKKEDEFVGVPNMDKLVMANGELDYLQCRNTPYACDICALSCNVVTIILLIRL
jgi:hypothetical protein